MNARQFHISAVTLYIPCLHLCFWALGSGCRGVDCPEYAEYMDATLTDEGEGRVVVDAICMFEQDYGTTSWRHTHIAGSFFLQI